MSLDHALADHARATGAKLLERTKVTGPLLDERTGRVVGVTARPVDDRGRRAGERRRVPRPRRHRRRRRLVAPRAVPRPGEADGPPDGRRRPDLLPHPPARRRLDGEPPRAVGRRAGALEPPAGVRLDLRARRRHRERRPRQRRLDAARDEGRLQGPVRALDGQRARRVGVHPGEPGRPGAGRRPADGLQPHPAVHPGPDARRGLRRHGQPRSTARASPTGCRPGRVAADAVVQAHARTTAERRARRAGDVRADACATTSAASTRWAGTSCGSSSTPRSCGCAPGTGCRGRSSCGSRSSCSRTATSRAAGDMVDRVIAGLTKVVPGSMSTSTADQHEHEHETREGERTDGATPSSRSSCSWRSRPCWRWVASPRA